MFKTLFTKRQKQNLGAYGEDLATAYLKQRRYKILARNYRNAKGRQVGEIDIIAQNDETIIFVEVKTRTVTQSSARAIVPEEQISQTKLMRLQKAAHVYLDQHNLQTVAFRFDAISVRVFHDDSREPLIEHLESIFL